jgi:protein-S-isoprenylcysteine O-methyltransferase Ste14
VTLLRAAALFLPLFAAWALVLRRTRREATGAFLATMWNLPAVLAVDLAARRLGWWSYGTQGGELGGMPVDLWFGWALAWGAVSALVFRSGLVLATAFAVAVDFATIPFMSPAIRLHSGWPLGEAVGVACCVVPGLILARLTAERRRPELRALLQLGAFGGLTLWVLPTAAFAVRGGGFAGVLERPHWLLGIGLQLLAIPALVAASAVQELAERGGGTPVPLDPPTRLVTSGAYAYVANPMQLGMALLLVGYGALLGNAWVAAIGPMGAAFSIGFAAWQERGDLERRYGRRWRAYRKDVRSWIPRWRPRHPEPALLYFATTCEPCSQVGRWLDARAPLALELVPAEDAPLPLERLTYVSADGRTEDGVRAMARALEHISLPWALLGFAARLPVLRCLLQVLVDAVGGGPRQIPTVAAPVRPR